MLPRALPNTSVTDFFLHEPPSQWIHTCKFYLLMFFHLPLSWSLCLYLMFPDRKKILILEWPLNAVGSMSVATYSIIIQLCCKWLPCICDSQSMNNIPQSMNSVMIFNYSRPPCATTPDKQPSSVSEKIPLQTFQLFYYNFLFLLVEGNAVCILCIWGTFV